MSNPNITQAQTQLVTSRHPRVLWSRLKLKWPFLVWLLAIGVIALFYQDTLRSGSVAGILEVIREESAPVETARLLKLHVHEGQQIKPGDLIAEFDTAIIDGEIAEITSSADEDQLDFATRAAELEARFKLDQAQIERQYERAIEDGIVRLRELNLQYDTDRTQTEVLSNQLRQITGLVGATLTEARDLVTYRSELDAAARRTSLYPIALRETEADIARAREQLAEARRLTNALAPVNNALAAQKSYAGSRELIAALTKRKESYTIRATSAATVSRINFRPGSVVPAAAPVVSLIVNGSERIIAYVPEFLVHQISIGTVGRVTQATRREIQLDATVTGVGPEIATLPGVASPIAGQPVRGRRITLAFQNSVGILPGETVVINFGDPAWARNLQYLRKRFFGEQTASASAPAAK